jgi:hypothetical protein
MNKAEEGPVRFGMSIGERIFYKSLVSDLFPQILYSIELSSFPPPLLHISSSSSTTFLYIV